MKAKELMIGDWVQTTFMGNKVPCKVVGISTDITIEYQNCARKYEALKDVEPILLTGEILEKNGFKVGYYLVGLTEKTEYKMVNRNELKNVEKNVITIRQSSDTLFDMQVGIGSHIYDITYVHELQHALKLCGIDKTIEL